MLISVALTGIFRGLPSGVRAKKASLEVWLDTVELLGDRPWRAPVKALALMPLKALPEGQLGDSTAWLIQGPPLCDGLDL